MTSSTPVLSSTDTPKAVSPARAAYLAGIGRTKLYELINAGEIPSIKIGKRRLIRLASLEAWLAAQEQA